MAFLPGRSIDVVFFSLNPEPGSFSGYLLSSVLLTLCQPITLTNGHPKAGSGGIKKKSLNGRESGHNEIPAICRRVDFHGPPLLLVHHFSLAILPTFIGSPRFYCFYWVLLDLYHII